jgi:hypothetical protein
MLCDFIKYGKMPTIFSGAMTLTLTLNRRCDWAAGDVFGAV